MRATQFLTPSHKLLVVDAIGAAATALGTFFLLAMEVIKTGLPTGLLYAMCLLAVCLAAFDLVAIKRRFNPATSLRSIACLNLSYCVLVVVSLVLYRQTVTPLGIAYFCIEVAIVVAVSVFEFVVASRDGT